MTTGKYVTLRQLQNESWKLALRNPLHLEYDYPSDGVALHYAPLRISVSGKTEEEAVHAFTEEFLRRYGRWAENGCPGGDSPGCAPCWRMFSMVGEIDFS